MEEKKLIAVSGYLFVLLALVCFGLAALFVSYGSVVGALLFVAGGFILKGIVVIYPNEGMAATFFGDYVGTIKETGLRWVNPLYSKTKISLRARNLNGQTLKVNDKMGNPVEIAAVVVWQVKDTSRALFDVDNYVNFVQIQSEAAVRKLANSYPYDHMEDETSSVTLRDSTGQINVFLEQELNERLERAGVDIIEARVSHLAYASEIAGAMLQRQQASAMIAARRLIVEGAVGMVEMALERLEKNGVIALDEERKAAMVSNLLVVLCGEKSVSPVVNAGTLYN
ncbi:SPFH domain-containing protein [Spirosoma sp. KCTC 42546]|uniref:SPFH domain-containing protein n=1 Tax=Spirosoma sp. KCTC 42546 TaxID=2520506 RepID=UPI001156F8A9|nr:SPFH domain-containing protein [Spirosoma sp. KCTC 42546]QDK81792.1 SPFH domain-containing protein [Spirosoma sp. KCTC 42546]